MIHSKYLKLLLVLGLLFFPFCEDDANLTPSNPGGSSDTWLISKDQIRDGGPGKDGIPALGGSLFIPLSEASYLFNNDLVIGVQIGDVVRAFPHPILDHHEIVNYQIDDTPFTVSYCPLTGSGMAWDAGFLTSNSTFGVSGLLYNSNLILYDRQSDSNWSQMLLLCVNGEFIGREATLIPALETTWGTWKLLFPDSQVMSNDTGFNNNYRIYPYGNYKQSDSLLFPVNHEDDRLHKKERVHGVIVSDKAKVYPISRFSGEIQIINDIFKEEEFLVVGSSVHNFAMSFKRKLEDGTLLTFNAVENKFPVILQDNLGNNWDLFGNAVSGPLQGEKLKTAKSFTGYWFAWAAFYPQAEIYGSTSGISVQNISQIKPLGQKNGATEGNKTTYRFSRIRLGTKLIRQLAQIRQEVYLPSRYDSDADSGFVIGNVSRSSIFSDLGLQPGDIVKSINGIVLDKDSNFGDIFQRLANESRFSVQLERDSEPMTLDYFVK